MNRVIITKYHGPAYYRGSRISAKDSEGNKIIIPYDCALNSEANHRNAAKKLCEKLGWPKRMQGGVIDKGYAFVLRF